MKKYGKWKEKVRRGTSLFLSTILTLMVFFPYLSPIQVNADDDTGQVTLTSAHGDFGGDHKLYCIDKCGLAIWGIADDGDVYENHKPSKAEQPLSKKEQEYIFWGILSLQASLGNKKANDRLSIINVKAQAQGKQQITKKVSEEDLKALIYSSSVRAKYPWLETVASNTEEYLKLAGLIGGSGSSTQSGKSVPSVIANNTSPSAAYQISRANFTIQFDAGGTDADFIQKVPILFSNDNGENYNSAPTDGWTYTKTSNTITFSNPNPLPPKALIKFEVEGTEYASEGGTYASEEDLFNKCLQIWECITCSGSHGGGTPPSSPPWQHQRMVWLELDTVPVEFYAALAGDPAVSPVGGEITFQVFRHAEDFIATYNTQLYKYDYETGKPLENARFVLYERFDDKDEIDTVRDGPVHIYEGGDPYASYHTDNPVIWNGFRKAGAVVTDSNGHASQSIEHGYHYDKTFCDGHPAPVFVPVPEPEEGEADETTGETGGILNEEQIEAAKTENRGLANAWLSCAAGCEDQGSGDFDGVHFHWMMSDVQQGEIENTASSGGDEGSTPDGGNTSEPDADTAYEESGCYQDMQDTYDKFISLKYSYAYTEYQARDGYIRHDLHSDDLPVEIITTDASENGANSSFAGVYSNKETLENGMNSAAVKVDPPVEITSREQELRRSSVKSSTVLPSFEFIDEDKDAEATHSSTQRTTSSRRATPSEAATPSEVSTPSEALFNWERSAFSFRNPAAYGDDEDMTTDLFTPAYEEALLADSTGDEITAGPNGSYSHCSNADGEGNAWRIYDHRTEGEFHINKKDLDLSAGETEQYSAYGDAQGDASLEGAVYGLFAAADITHPDGKTGVVYKANNLTAIATTDKNGDASFLANTEAPGYVFDYKTGSVLASDDGWAAAAPKNLCVTEEFYDDYAEDGQYNRSYQNNEENNGSCWIGRPLLMGDYYIKELSRSEGYELSIGEKLNDITNINQDMNVKTPEDTAGYALISQPLYAEEQTSDDGKGAGPNEMFFEARSKDTTNQQYDVVLTNLPDGVRFYRKETGSRQTEVQVGTGIYEKVLLTNADGTPKYIKAENDYQYPKYNQDGSLMTKSVPINFKAERFRQVAIRELDATVIQNALNKADDGMSADENRELLFRPFSEANLSFVKGKVENALRKNGKSTPRTPLSGGGGDYSSIYVGVFDSGVRKGDTDVYGLSGVTPGSPAAYTVYGSPIQKTSINKENADGTPVTVGDAVLSVLKYYNDHPFYSFGGIDAVEENASEFIFTIYAGVSGNPDNFMVLGSDPEGDSIIHHGVKYIPGTISKPPRLIYASYSNNTVYHAFGTYEDYKDGTSGASVIGSATLITDAVADEDGNLQTKMTVENVFYQTGELVRDENGNLMQAFEYREITRTETQEVEDVRWQEIPIALNGTGSYVLTVNADYTDAFGVSHSNIGTEQTIGFKVVLKEKEAALTDEEAAALGNGFTGGHLMDSASYYVHVRRARAKAYLDYLNMSMAGENTYVMLAGLIYPGQEIIYQDSGTRDNPVHVFERPIRQKIKIVKDILTTPEGTYDHNTNAESGYEDGFTTGAGGAADSATKLDNFRFRLYQKSNLERLYRNEAGGITWLDRDGKAVDIKEYKASYPKKEPFGSAQKLYTKVPHMVDSKTTGSINNNVWDKAVTANKVLYTYGGNGLIQDAQNPGYTRLLETTTKIMEDGAGKTREVDSYNYEKFFDAIQTANHDKWDRKDVISLFFKPKANALRSDAVRQFAVTWYLEDEVRKLVRNNGTGESEPGSGSESYQDEVYDHALKEAAVKAENYLRPFFAYNLDAVYSVEWDGTQGGGSDKDRTTLSADTFYQTTGNGVETSRDGYFYGVSKYLPYGTYVAVEQQPDSAELGDFYNKHYKTDIPREITLPSVYEAGGNVGSPERLNAAYEYHSSDSPKELQRRYYLRFNEEWDENHLGDLRKYVIRAHNADGDFEIYKYGLAPDKMTGTITYGGGTYNYAGFRVSQELSDPYKDIYKAENSASGYPVNQTVEKYYRYGSLSEDGGSSDNVLYQHGAASDDNNPSGQYFKDGVKTITGSLTAYDDLYAAALVPWTVTEPLEAGTYNVWSFIGYADGKYRNTFYSSKLRIEKLDAETGENILHDGALFSIYSAKRDDGENENGRVQFYSQDTLVTGSREFLEAMCAKDITPAARPSLPWEVSYNGKYYGTVSEGTPICNEKDQIILVDEQGTKTGRFKAYSTTGDIEMAGQENSAQKTFAAQNAGCLETPQPLGAGCYVIAEVKPTSGYTRSRPTAIEIYSDEAAYYLNGNKDDRVLSTIYEYDRIRTDDNGAERLNPDGTRPNMNKPQDKGDTARVYVNNTPIRLEVTKAKADDTQVIYELNGRREGSITELTAAYGLENLELAFNSSGRYLYYGWKKGFLDSLKRRQAAGEHIEILYEDGVFTGIANLYKVPDTADDTNRYLPGALMTLYDALEVKQSGDSEDFRYSGVNVERDKYGNVTRMYVQKGYAGTRLKYVLEKTDPGAPAEDDYKNYTYDQQEDDKGGGIWNCKTIEREDTDILYYDLGGLDVLKEENGFLYGHDKNGKKVQVKNGASSFALKNGTPFLEIICGDYENLHYSSKDRVFDKVPAGTLFYHLDGDGNRDSQTDPYTGMAYTMDENAGKLLVWPIELSRDAYGNILAREKIKTSRIAAIHADTEEEYTVGTYESGTPGAPGTSKKPAPTDLPILPGLRKRVNPILDQYGLPVYYQKSKEIYKKGTPIYDRDGDYVRYHYDDALKAYNDNAYNIETNETLNNIGIDKESTQDDAKLYRREGESYLIENTWTTGEKTPNDPFTTEMTSGQADVLKRVPAGTYIMEEITPPSGYVKTMPVGLTVSDITTVQTVKATDHTINTYFEKEDAPTDFRVRIQDKDSVFDTAQTVMEGKGSYTYKNIAGAELALFRARQVKTEDTLNHPSGFYLEKTENTPASWTVLDNHNQKVIYTAKWITKELPQYIETVPKGFYILEEITAPSGYVRASMEIEVRETGDLQRFCLPNDHIKIEIFKYMEEETGKKEALGNENPAGLAVYEAVTDADGIVMENGLPRYDKNKLVDAWTTDDCKDYAEFIREYEKLFYEYGDKFETIAWNGATDKNNERTAVRLTSESTDKQESVTQMWVTDTGKQISVSASKNLTGGGTAGCVFDYRFNFKELNTAAYPDAVSYDKVSGTHRMDYLPLNGTDRDGNKKGYYVLVETKVPDGFAAADEKPIVAGETADIQLYALKNEPKYIYISKVSEDGKGLYGAGLALYKAAADGSLIMDEDHLFAAWTSGEDGSYTTEDFYSGLILPGFSVGDLKPHRLSKVPYGTYYLAELTAPSGYIKMEPERLEITSESPLVVTAVNRVKKGILSIRKVDTEEPEKVLPGARFEVKNKDTDEIFYLITDEKGEAKSQPLTIGSIGKNGVFTPYRFSIREVAPPDTYELNLTVHHFQFTDDGAGVTLSYSYELGDRPTELFISKSGFDGNEFLKGARLAVFNTRVTDGTFEPDGAPLEEWISDGRKHRIKGKLSAGRTYMLKELEAPSGYTLSAPVMFTLSDDGRRIVNVTNHLKIVKFQTSGSFIDAVESVTILGRQAVETEVVLTDLDTGSVLNIPSYQSRPLTEEDGLTDGHLYELKELTHYTDGNHLVSGRSIFRMSIDENGEYAVTKRLTDKTKLKLQTADGAPIVEWNVENINNSGYAHTIANPEYEDGQSVKVISENGRYGAGVMSGSVIKYEITYKNTSLKEKTIRIKAVLDPQIEYMPAVSTGGGWEFNGTIYWTIRKVQPGESGSITVTAAVGENADLKIENNIIIEGTGYKVMNPVAKNGGLSIANHASGTAGKQLMDSSFTYRIYLEDEAGQPLPGRFPFTGSAEGTVTSGGSLVLQGDEYVTLTGMVWGTHYRVEQELPEDLNGLENLQSSLRGTEGRTGEEGVTAIFLNRMNDHSIREIFRKNETYHLTETTCYSDGSQSISDRMSFTLDEYASVGDIDMKDKPTHVFLSKTDITGSRELPGARLIIKNEDGEVVEEWISTDTPYELTAVLEPGKTYTLTEILPPDGYAYAQTIPFTVSADGTVDMVQMKDKATKVEISKTEITGGQELSGAKLAIRDAHGVVVERWVSDGTPHIMTGKLKAGETYTLVETAAPDGYLIADPVTFTVSTDGSIDTVEMQDEPTRIFIEKRGYTASPDGETDLGQLDGAHIRIEDKNKNTVYQFITKGGEHHEITGILTAGETYTAVETEAPYGYELAPPVTFTMPEDGEIVTIVMRDRKTPLTPDKPPKETPDKPSIPELEIPIVIVGSITAKAGGKLTGAGAVEIRKENILRIPTAGEFYNSLPEMAAWLLLACSLILLLQRKRRHR